MASRCSTKVAVEQNDQWASHGGVDGKRICLFNAGRMQDPGGGNGNAFCIPADNPVHNGAMAADLRRSSGELT